MKDRTERTLLNNEILKKGQELNFLNDRRVDDDKHALVGEMILLLLFPSPHCSCSPFICHISPIQFGVSLENKCINQGSMVL